MYHHKGGSMDGRADGLADGRIMGIAETVSKLMKINNMKIENAHGYVEKSQRIFDRQLLKLFKQPRPKEMNVS